MLHKRLDRIRTEAHEKLRMGHPSTAAHDSVLVCYDIIYGETYLGGVAKVHKKPL